MFSRQQRCVFDVVRRSVSISSRSVAISSSARASSSTSSSSLSATASRRAFATSSGGSRGGPLRAADGDDKATLSSAPLAADDVRALVARVEMVLRQEEERRAQQALVLAKVEAVRKELEPLERAKAELDSRASNRANYVMWAGLAYMGFQFGLLARLTWWEYSWDIVEPITYFVTYGTGIFFYCYYIITREEHCYLGAEKRQQLLWLHRLLRSQKSGSSLDVSRYNQLRAQLDAQLQKLVALGPSAASVPTDAAGADAPKQGGAHNQHHAHA